MNSACVLRPPLAPWLAAAWTALCLLVVPLRAAALDVAHYDLQLAIKPDTQHLSGKATLTLAVSPAEVQMAKLALDFVGFEVAGVTVNDQAAKFARSGGQLQVDLPTGLTSTTIQVAIAYAGTPQPYTEPWGTWGVVFAPTRVFTVNVTDGARYWLPCHDTIADKATLRMRIAVPQGWAVAAPGSLAATQTTADGDQFDWQANWPIPTYLFHFSAGKYTLHQDVHKGTPLMYWLDKTAWETAKATLDHVPAALDMLTGMYGAYPFPKVGVDEIALSGALEVPSCIAMGTGVLASYSGYPQVVAHELAHSWFQGLVSLADWKDIWLSEGLATYHEALFAEYTSGNKGLVKYVDNLGIVYRGSTKGSEPIAVYDPPRKDLFGTTVYLKGALVWHALRAKLGTEKFLAVLNAYIAKYKYGNASTEDFRAVAQAVSGQQLGQFFGEWVYGRGWPELQIGWRVRGLGQAAQLDLQIEQVQPGLWPLFVSVPLLLRASDDGTPAQVFSTPITLTGHLTQLTLSPGFVPTDVAIDPDHAILRTVAAVDFVADAEPTDAQSASETSPAVDGADAAAPPPHKAAPSGSDGGCEATPQGRFSDLLAGVALLAIGVVRRRLGAQRAAMCAQVVRP